MAAVRLSDRLFFARGSAETTFFAKRVLPERLDKMKPTTFFALTLIMVAFAIGTTVKAQVEGGAIAAVDEPSDGGGGGKPTAAKTRTSGSRTVKGKTARPVAVKAVAQNRTPKKWDGFVVGDKYTFMNFEVISAAKPYHTRAAKAGGASGLVQVEVLIDTNGSVLTARARTGNKLLHPEAERAALESKFNRPAVYGKPARAIGFLVYRFGRDEEE